MADDGALGDDVAPREDRAAEPTPPVANGRRARREPRPSHCMTGKFAPISAAGVVMGNAISERCLQDRPARLLAEDDLLARLLVDDLGHLAPPVQSGRNQLSPMTRWIML